MEEQLKDALSFSRSTLADRVTESTISYTSFSPIRHIDLYLKQFQNFYRVYFFAFSSAQIQHEYICRVSFRHFLSDNSCFVKRRLLKLLTE